MQKEAGITHVFQDAYCYNDLFYTGRFDFVVYERQPGTKADIPILAIELDGREHGFELIRIENTYACRYQFMKDILMKYFASVKEYR